MASAAVDHMISLIIFMSAVLIFIGLFSNTMQTGVTYERHRDLSTKTSDLLDTILLNPGMPSNWAKTDSAIAGFGLQDPQYSKYKLSPYSPMRLYSTSQSPVYYPRTHAYYSNNTAGFGSYLLMPSEKSLSYSTVTKLLGINGTYGFQLTLTPTMNVTVEKTSVGAPLRLSVVVTGTASSVANAPLSYTLLLVSHSTDDYPSYTTVEGLTSTDSVGSAQLVFSGVDGESQTYALIVYSYLSGLKGTGCYVHVPPSVTKTVVPLVDSFQNRNILLAHGDSVGQPSGSPQYSELKYTASFAILAEDYSIRDVSLDQSSSTGTLIYGSDSEQEFSSIIVPNNDGILIVTYKDAAGGYGVVLMPWGLGSLGFQLTFGGSSQGRDWVTTDIRQVSIGDISYLAKLELWSVQGYQGVA
jgi:hypothetical protein